MRLFKYKEYKDRQGLYYVYMHLYNNRVIYIGKGSGARGRDFANRSIEYKEYIKNIGKENIITYIIEESYDEELILHLEMLVHKLFLDKGLKLFSKPQFGEYGCLKGRIISKETRIKLSKSRNGKKHTQETKYKIGNARRGSISTLRREIVQLTLDNTFVKQYDNIRELDKLGFHNSAIVMCCRRKRNKHKGYKWMYKEDYKLINMNKEVI